MLIVQKYGGTSVANTDRIRNVAARVAKYHAKGDQIVVVVSAMSGVTDSLIKLAKDLMPLPNEREMDVLLATGEQTTTALTAIALHAFNIPAASLTGAQAGIVSDVRSSLNDNPGTIVKEETKNMEDIVVRGVSLDKNQAKVTLVGVPDQPGVAARIFKAIGDANVNVDMIVQNISHGSGKPATDLSFAVDKPDLLKARKVIDALKPELGFAEVIATDNIGKLSIIGVGMKSHTGDAGKMFETLASEGVNIDMISTSEIKISVVIDLAKSEQAMKAIHEAFLGR